MKTNALEGNRLPRGVYYNVYLVKVAVSVLVCVRACDFMYTRVCV